jgi:thioredoxin-like negative regulator of GroEL
LDVDHANEISAKYGVRSIPTAITFKAGKVAETKIGYPGEAFYRGMLDRVTEGEGAPALAQAA